MFGQLDMRKWQLLAEKIYQANVEKGFWDEDHPLPHCVMLVVCEVCELIEADRSARRYSEILCIEYLREEAYPVVYEMDVKYTVEGELADVAMRLLDLIGRKKWNVGSWAHSYNRNFIAGKSLVEVCYSLVKTLVYAPDGIEFAVVNAFYIVLSVAEKARIDLVRHIEMKMKYNRYRPLKNGKIY